MWLYRFLDSEVIAPDFRDKLEEVARVVQPFVHWSVSSPFLTFPLIDKGLA